MIDIGGFEIRASELRKAQKQMFSMPGAS